ncbi:MAG: alkaline phosphatase family protein [Acidobacteriia bacterium]|nr:alkaline phosphatase family protein [Terriglobia bacterium]
MRHLRRLGHSLVAGAFAGAALAPLQLLLWPDVLPPLPKLLVAFLAWTTWGTVWIGGTLFAFAELASLLVPYLGSAKGFSVGLWRWLMIPVGLVVTWAAWWNREETRDLLLPDNRQGLAYAGSLAFLFTITLLVLAIRRRSRRHALTSALAFAGALVAALWVVWACTPLSSPKAAVAEAVHFAPGGRLLFVSWEGTDLHWLLPAMERGDMPFLHKRWETGAWGQLRTVRPYTRSATLATLVTGCAPAVHGVLGRLSYRVPWLTDRPVTLLLAGPWPSPHQLPWRAWERTPGLAPQRATLWQILTSAGHRVGVVGWPRYARGSWTVSTPLPAEVARFTSLDADLRAALDSALRSAPDLANDARNSFALAAGLGSIAVKRVNAQPVNALAIDCELAAHLRPLWTAEEPGGQGDEVLRQAARVLDDQLRSLWLAMGEDTLLVVVSPYGLAPPSPWQRLVHLARSSPRWHVSPTDSPDGFVLFSGPGVRPGTRLTGARLADVTATLLYLLELPVARDMAGRVLLNAVDEARAASVPLRLVPSYPADGSGTASPTPVR